MLAADALESETEVNSVDERVEIYSYESVRHVIGTSKNDSIFNHHFTTVKRPLKFNFNLHLNHVVWT